MKAYTFLAPISIAALLTMILLPIARFLERKGLKRSISTLLSSLIALILYFSIFVILSLQANSIYENKDKIMEHLATTVESLQQSVENIAGLSPEKQMEILNIPPSVLPSDDQSEASAEKTDDGTSTTEAEESESSKGAGGPDVKTAITEFLSFLTYSILTFIYIFFFLFYRKKIRLSILKIFSNHDNIKTNKVLKGSLAIAQNYLVGRLILIFFLWIIYSVGMAVSGIDSPIIISLIAALLSLIPYVGTVIGYFIAMLMALVSGGQTSMFIGVSITYGLAQFIETYILEPFIVGDKVDLNPMVTIIVVILGGSLWGVVGMVISIPFFGILKIVADQIPELRPLGYFLGKEDTQDSDDEDQLGKLADKIKGLFK
ncbi:AI-2E family transporter [Echinicola pacifica]|nr:AI-2E family transporter [Echinicola pacifica]